MKLSSITIAFAFLLSGVQFVNATPKYYILRSKINGQCCSSEAEVKVTFGVCDLTNLETKFLWQDQMLTETVAGDTGKAVFTGLILNYSGTSYAVPKKAFIKLVKLNTKAATYKKGSWTVGGDQIYSAKDFFWSYNRPLKTTGIKRDKVILNADGEYENSLIEKIYVTSTSVM